MLKEVGQLLGQSYVHFRRGYGFVFATVSGIFSLLLIILADLKLWVPTISPIEGIILFVVAAASFYVLAVWFSVSLLRDVIKKEYELSGIDQPLNYKVIRNSKEYINYSFNIQELENSIEIQKSVYIPFAEKEGLDTAALEKNISRLERIIKTYQKYLDEAI